ncbi:MAG: HD domain-containing protein [Faecousia sp.]
MNRELVEKTEAFLKETFDASPYLQAHPADKAYRFQHTYRVANIAKGIAEKEGFDVTAAVIAGLFAKP